MKQSIISEVDFSKRELFNTTVMTGLAASLALTLTGCGGGGSGGDGRGCRGMGSRAPRRCGSNLHRPGLPDSTQKQRRSRRKVHNSTLS